MLTINCTAKLRDELDFEIEPVAEDKDDFYNWHANLFRFNRRKCVILMNVKSRYSIVLYGLKKNNFKDFSNLCRQAIRKNFKADKIDERYIEKYMDEIEVVKYTKTYDRSILGSMNSTKQDTEFRFKDFLPTRRMNLTRLNKANNRTPILSADIAYPIEALENAFEERMGKLRQKVYYFKVSLKDIEPQIWRRIGVPATYTFWNLHVAIQDAMGWLDYHLHEFKIKNPDTEKEAEISYPDMDGAEHFLISWEERIADYFDSQNKKATYIYDFGDYWQHEIELEEISPAQEGEEYPVCLDGARACPREDCGGVGGYERLLEVLADPEHDDYQHMKDWAGSNYDPEYFKVEEVEFDDPERRLSRLKLGW
ncbi:plasmid pRiA4b ORF-3 family protein [Fuchsiella alkaliacetigena]|uniref:plasmid pRiA4b ORF-3 family protein n=1 Tax=Fuchsiella alkaliacetigena TaxID=957042 RepID=UPI00200A47EF|nr:plasmid pRiA4b ORF-3 family protein [Fuchsiella alkaliacetigena]MCK8825659.1 plasmid pRiA4b ORF-3 family protein [Fuchsiella alkaliacetigena]